MDYVGKVNRKKNPREKANILNLLTFGYTVGLFRKGLKKELEEEDLYEVIKTCRSTKCGDKLEKYWKIEKQKKKVSMIRLLWIVFGSRYIVLGLLHLTWKLFKSTLEPEAVGKLVSYFNPFNKHKLTVTFDDALYYAGVMIGIRVIHCFYFQNYVIYVQQLGIQIRTSFCSLIYRKALRLTPSAMNDISLGNIITVVTKDVLNFESSLWLINDMWIETLRCVLTTYLIYNKMGAESLVGIGILLSVIPIQVYASKILRRMRLKVNKRTDERLQVTQETLSAIKIIKMYTWEKLFNDKVDESRRKELYSMMSSFFLKSAMICLGIFTSKVAFYSMVMVYIWLNEVASAEVMFYVMECFKDLKHSIGIIIPLGFGRVADLTASISRINRVLNAEELPETDSDIIEKTRIIIEKATVKIKEKEILKDISWRIRNGLTVVTGPLGCGKSSLLKVCLKDYPLSKGSIVSEGTISYSSQDPWLFPSTIKQNILFGEEFNENRYKEVIRACALQYDFSLMDNGDETIVADRGINLSRGQQARINLARAVYKDSDVYLLDDPLNALDSKIQNYVFNNCINGFLKGRIVVMVSHNKRHIDSSDNVVVMKEGTVMYEGKRQEILNEVLEEIEEEYEEKEHQEEMDEEDENSKLLTGKKSYKRVYSEVKKEGSVELSVYKRYFKFGGGIFMFILLPTLFIITEAADSFGYKLVTMWINTQNKIIALRNNITEAYLPLNESTAIPPMNNTNVDYISNITIQLKEVEAEASFRINLYTAMIVATVGTELIKSYFFLRFTRNASINIHKSMIKTLTKTVMTFYDNYFIGNILNRFSQDLSVVDEHLPHVLNIFISLLFSCAGLVSLIVSVNVIFAIPCVVFVAILVALRFIYMPTARSLKRLESATRSPLIGHLNASMEGVTTVRAYKTQRILEKEFDKHQDLYTSAHFTSFCTKRAFGFFMDLISVIFLTIVVSKFLFFSSEDEPLAGNVGLAITKATALSGMVQWSLMQWSELENSMTSVERVLEYTELPEEKYGELEIEDWPSKGEIVYKNVSLRYVGTNEKCLKNVSFSVGSKEKIGIVGRTGAGKSSIISTLFKLYDFDGTIDIDNVDIKTLSLKFIRDKISIIPQEPILFQGNIRDNIDPFKKYTDEEIWSVIDKVKMKNAVESLDIKITDHGSNFSTGQRQLLSLARAIIRNNKIVVLDEATANMDPETEKLIHQTIVDNFSDCTVLIIAHRLQSVLDCNKVMVLDKGEIKEYDDPVVLTADENSMFSKLLKRCDNVDA